ncbi:CstA-like transporter-associated (seleno)protein [Nonomuraea sp. ATR24]|uniref:CstA-like transporter-associated (seleno)protein n=1 Tax=Nonomuraea TaxID=83681 RepID=UPI001C5CC618|nr:CstA-like transporter-associated (seleno)protein [Nonomuraea ceibae]
MKALRFLRWYVRELTGTAAYERYADAHAAHGGTPMSRREYERRRSDLREAAPESRCC